MAYESLNLAGGEGVTGEAGFGSRETAGEMALKRGEEIFC